MKLRIRTEEYEISKLPFESISEIIIYDFDTKSCAIYSALIDRVEELELELELLDPTISQVISDK